MEGLGRFNINFAKLKLGEHHYNFSINNEFFDHFEYSLIDKAQVKVCLALHKEQETLLTLKFHLEGQLTLACDRCLDEYEMPLKKDEQLIVKLSESEKEDDAQNDEIMLLRPEAIDINVAKPIFDFLNLSKPMKPTCEDVEKACNKEMLDKLKELQKAPKDKDEIDPRWEKLKTFFNQNNN